MEDEIETEDPSEDDTDPDELEDITVDEVKSFLDKGGYSNKCYRCQKNNWFYPTGARNNALAVLATPYYPADRNHGFTLISRVCVTCGNVENYSHAVISYDALIERKRK